jgi:predicted ATPase
LRDFKRFDDITIDLGDVPLKIIALVGPNGSGKSSVFDAFEEKLKDFRSYGSEGDFFLSKRHFSSDETIKRNATYNRNQSISIETTDGTITRKSFYIRTAYRFTSKLNVQNISAMPEMLETRDEPISSIALDSRLESNYKRLLASAYSDFYAGDKTGNQVRDSLVGKINKILLNVIDAEILDLGNIMDGRGQLYFKKGESRGFPYSNLSSGEKEVVDIILDLVIKTREYNDTVICIDEPELHINTAVQRRLIVEIEKLIPDSCQLWIATHSIGFLRALQEELRHKSQVFDFSEKNYFSGKHTITPVIPNRKNWLRIFGTALEDLTSLLSPRKIVYCEGKDMPGVAGKERGLDAHVYNHIFSESRTDTLFISSGGNTELDQRSEIAIKILTKVFSDIEILVLKDRDMASGMIAGNHAREIYLKNNPENHRVLGRFELENYLYDKSVLAKYCDLNDLSFNENEYDALIYNIADQDVKGLTTRIKNICGINSSISPDVFKVNLSKVISADMSVYCELELCIFGK